jgi:hypothetical protein
MSSPDFRVNRAMLDKLKRRKAIDVSKCRRTSTGAYILAKFTDGVDYCDALTGTWIWSIGETLRPLPSELADGSREVLPVGTFLAATDGRFYSAEESPTIKCVWLR